MTTQNPEGGSKNLSLKLTDDFHSFVLDVQIKVAAVERRMLSVSAILRNWLNAARAIYGAKTREEARAVADALFDSNPDNKEAKQ